MKKAQPLSTHQRPFCFSLTASILVLFAVGFTVACGSGSSSEPKLSGNTSVTMMLSGTANDQLSGFNVGFQGISLTSQSGKTVTFLSMPTSGPPLGAEFTHINGTAEPLVTATIPQDVYTSATVSLGGASISCVALGPVDGEETLSSAFFDLLPQPATAAVTFPSPITVTSTNMGLSLDLLVSQSATIGDCLNVDGFSGFSITPTFNLTPLTLSSSPTNSANGKVIGLDGEVTAIGSGGSSLTLSIPDLEGSRPLSVSSDSKTAYQGISGFSALTVGTFLDMDGAIQSDGSLLATRVAVADTSAGDVFRGPLMEVIPSVSEFLMNPHNWQGKDVLGFGGGGGFNFNYDSAAFTISGQLTNLGSLPFVASFNASNMVPGQEVYISIFSSAWNTPRPAANTVTLMPQTINGAVTTSSKNGNFTDYTVSLASYDLFPMLAVQPGQSTVENNPSQVEVYVDSNTQLLNTQPLGVGSTFRFYGLVFNDNGTLRMDCAQVNDGVTGTSQSNEDSHSDVDHVQTVRSAGRGGLPQAITVVTSSH